MKPSGAALSGAAFSLGRTWHRRLRPVDRSFAYDVLFLWLPMRQWQRQGLAQAPARNRFGALSFYDRDHGMGGPNALAWVEQLLQENGVIAPDFDGEIWLQTLPRVMGFAFKPVSFWHVERAQGGLVAVLAEVNNTFGERHCYLLKFDEMAAAPSASKSLNLNTAQVNRFVAGADKVFHVSPFCATEGRYDFEFRSLGDWRSARINLSDDQGPLLKTSLCGRLEPYQTQRAWRLVAKMPWAALMVVWRIHWQAVHLFWQRVPFFRQPPAPTEFVTK